MEIEASTYDIGRTLNVHGQSYIIHFQNGSKFFKPFDPTDELKQEPYLLGLDSQSPDLDLPTTLTASSISDVSNMTTKDKVKATRVTSAYHQFLKDKTTEYADKFPDVPKKKRFEMILAEWKSMKS